MTPAASPPLPPRLRFGRIELQVHERRLIVDGQEAVLGGRAFDLLLALASRAGHLVSKHELLDLVWPGLVVEEANLPVQVSNLRKVLGGDVIATIPGRGYRFTATPHAEDAAAGSAPAGAAVARHAPAVEPLIARESDLATVERALQRPGCITLAGSSGIGKTSLARHLAAAWPAGAVWVDLAALSGDTQVDAALARALGVPAPAPAAAGALASHLGERLLVLDNAEHLVDAAAALASALLRESATLHLLVTSQWPLALAAERVHRLEPLPADGSLALLLQRARSADHRFAPAPDAEPLLREICAQLDGLPLALEMAGARLPALGVKGLHGALSSRFALLQSGYRDAAGRHRTLRAALDWSHGLLGSGEQRLFRALGVFCGGFTLELALQVACDDVHDRGSVIDSLSLLVERSLVAVSATDPPRYGLLETMRAYALDRLAQTDEAPALRQRLALAMFDLFKGPAVNARLDATALAEHDNARESVAWAAANDPALALPLSVAVSRVATFASWRLEAGTWVESCAAVETDPRIAPLDRAGWWEERTRLRVMSLDPGARQFAQRSLEIARTVGDDRSVFRALMSLIRATRTAEADLPSLCDEAQAQAARHPEWPSVTQMHLAGVLAHSCEVRNDPAGKLVQRQRELELARKEGLHLLAEVAETNVIAALLDLHQDEQALAHADALLARIGHQESLNVAYAWKCRFEALVVLQRFDDVRADAVRAMAVARRFRLPVLWSVLAFVAAHTGRPRAAALLIGHTRTAHEAAGRGTAGKCETELAATERAALEVLDAAEFERLVAQGRSLDDDAALQVFVGDDDGA